MAKLKTGTIEMHKRIILLYSSKDSGHQHAAKAIKEALKLIEPSVETLDVEAISFISPKLGKLVHKAYLGMVEKNSAIYDYLWDNQKIYRGTNGIKKIINQLNQNKFRKLFDEFKPHAAICTQAFPCGIISKLKEKYDIPFKLIAVITDYDVHSYWIYKNVDYYMVATPAMKEELQKKGIAYNKIKITGIPVSPVFKKNKDRFKLKKKLNISTQGPVVLIMGGTLGLGPILGIIRELDKIDENFELIVITGRNKKLKTKLDSLIAELNKPLKVYGYIDNIDELMGASRLLITKPGGLTITEALVKRLPMVIYNAVGGQETRNYKFLIDKNIAIESKNLQGLKNIVKDLLKNPKKLENLIKNINSFTNPNASLDIANIVLKSI